MASMLTNWTTAGGNCQIIYNLTFCNQTAYAVPSNPNTFANASALAAFYDGYAASMWSTFETVLAQVQCETSSTQRYSLVRDCTDCAAAYRSWLCSVAIPRCEDFANDAPWLQPRAVGRPYPNGTLLPEAVRALYPDILAFNSSRNPIIDQTVKPGPYKEIMPCADLCYGLVQSCSSAIGFMCPLPGQYGFNTSYGRRTAAEDDGAITCNYPGSAHFFSGAPGVQLPRPWGLVACAATAAAILAL